MNTQTTRTFSMEEAKALMEEKMKNVDLRIPLNTKILSKRSVYDQTSAVESAASRSLQSTESRSINYCDDFEKFLGFWMLETKDDWINATAVEFFVGENGRSAKWYTGTQKELREIQVSDSVTLSFFGFNDLCTTPVGFGSFQDVVDVDVISPNAVRFYNIKPRGVQADSKDELRSTFAIQDYDQDLAYCQLWTVWDGSADDPDYGEVENLMRFRRLHETPKIIRRDSAGPEWNDPVKLFEHMIDLYRMLGNNEITDSYKCEQYIGNVEFEKLKQTLLTTGLSHSYNVTTDKRAGYHWGVWVDQATGLVKMHFNGPSNILYSDRLEISGFTGQYAILNGNWDNNQRYRNIGEYRNYRSTHVDTDSSYSGCCIQTDTRSITELYDPSKHGVGTVQISRAPITSESSYRDLISALGEILASFGIGTHNYVGYFVDGDTGVCVESWERLSEVLASGNFGIGLNRGRKSYYPLTIGATYHNRIGTGDISYYEFDPTGLSQAISTAEEGDPKFDYDIDIENYLCASYNLYFAVTGPVLPNEPITSQLKDTWGSNGSQIVFKMSRLGVVPEPLVDYYGTHPWNMMQTNSATDPTQIKAAQHQFVFGIVDPELTRCRFGDKKVAYLRFYNTGGFDNFTDLGMRSLVFGRNDMPGRKHLSNHFAANAEILKKLNRHDPDVYILDIRDNGGGMGSWNYTIASFFGDNRAGLQDGRLDFADSVEKTVSREDNPNIRTANNGYYISAQKMVCDVDFIRSKWPKSVVEGCENYPKSVVILDDVGAGSGGDMFARYWQGSDKSPAGNVHDIGNNVYAQIVGNLDGRLYNGITFRCPPTSVGTPFRFQGQLPICPLFILSESGIGTEFDEHGYIGNQGSQTAVSKLIPLSYDRMWQEFGVIDEEIYEWPLGDEKPSPNYDNPRTYRDIGLETAIVEGLKKVSKSDHRSKCHSYSNSQCSSYRRHRKHSYLRCDCGDCY